VPDKLGPAHPTSAWERTFIFKDFPGNKGRKWTKKAENRQESDREKTNKAEIKRGIEKRKFRAQNFQKVRMLLIMTVPRISRVGVGGVNFFNVITLKKTLLYRG